MGVSRGILMYRRTGPGWKSCWLLHQAAHRGGSIRHKGEEMGFVLEGKMS